MSIFVSVIQRVESLEEKRWNVSSSLTTTVT